MRRGFGLAGLLVTVILLVVVGAIAYNVGWSDGVNTHLPAATQGDGTPAVYYGPHYWGGGFGFFGILWFLLILFGIFWLFRIACWGFFGRRMWLRARLRPGLGLRPWHGLIRGEGEGLASPPAR